MLLIVVSSCVATVILVPFWCNMAKKTVNAQNVSVGMEEAVFIVIYIRLCFLKHIRSACCASPLQSPKLIVL